MHTIIVTEGSSKHSCPMARVAIARHDPYTYITAWPSVYNDAGWQWYIVVHCVLGTLNCDTHLVMFTTR